MNEQNNQQNENINPASLEEEVSSLSKKQKATNKLLIIFGAIGAIFVVTTIVLLCILLGGKDKPDNDDNPSSGNQNQSNGDHVHTPAVAVVENKIPATCTTDGSYDLVVYCAGCGVKITWNSHIESALGHTYVNRVCLKCGDKKTYSEGLAFTSNADGTCFVSGIGNCTDSVVVIPPTSPDGDSVTSIGGSAFLGCTGLTSITIPDSVTSIVASAFHGCTGLTSITVDANNPKYKSIDGNLYTKDGKTLIKYAIGTADTYFAIPDSVISIGYDAFYGCTGLTNITIGNGVTSVGVSAFRGCTGLASITIPDGVTSIGGCAFYGCEKLTSVTIPDGVSSIGVGPFVYCTSLTSITVDANNPNYKSIDGNLYTKDGKTLIQHAIGKADTYFAIPDSVTSIGEGAFWGCTGLTSITIPDSVTSIGDFAFSGCTGLTSVTISDGVISIGISAFRDCTGLETVYYKGGEEDWARIDNGVFGNENLTNANIIYNYED